MTGGDFGAWFVTGVTPLARTAVGQWPSGKAWTQRLVKALTDAADNEPDRAKKSRLSSAADALRGFARDVAVGVFSSGISGAAGL